ncbi:MAG: CRISPR-associated endonuclease Cas2 [Chloroflexi bacterium]|nr:CRISPR-associated endonuclease Cas2 [Chloroflexota bacterium]
MGQCLVVYDISHDRTRSRVADLCLDYGLDRIQFSAFLGSLTRTHQEELMLRVKRLLGKREGNVQLFPLCQKDWQARQVVANAPGKAKESTRKRAPAKESAAAPQDVPSAAEAILGDGLPDVEALAVGEEA